jgi:hypothetical protein
VLYKTLLTQEYEGDFSSRRAIISTYQFIAKSHIYNQIKAIQPIIDFNYTLKDFDGITYE